MSSDIRGYYALLGVAHDATAQSVKAAFRKLAKEHHPDTGVSDGGARFRAINEAYAVLGDPTARAAYDSESATEPAQGNSNKARVIDPITCGTCGQVTAQPRYVVFRHVISFILGTVRTPIQGIYCVACAQKAAFRANLITALAGWWGFPWGPIWTIAEGFKNALGGSSDTVNEERLLWHNALAFASRGDHRLSFALASRLRRAGNAEIAGNAEKLVNYLKSQGGDYSGSTLKNAWHPQIGPVAAQIAMLATLPALIATLVIFADSHSDSLSSDYSSSASVFSPPPVISAEENSTAAIDAIMAEAPIVPECPKQLANGEQLDGEKRPSSEGHMLEISNGSGGDAIIKLRHWPSNKLVASFLVLKNHTGNFQGFPDGNYIIQYAYGERIAEDCKSFVNIDAAGQFPDTETFKTDVQLGDDGFQMKSSRLSYTLYATPGGTVRPESLDPAAFNAD